MDGKDAEQAKKPKRRGKGRQEAKMEKTSPPPAPGPSKDEPKEEKKEQLAVVIPDPPKVEEKKEQTKEAPAAVKAELEKLTKEAVDHKGPAVTVGGAEMGANVPGTSALVPPPSAPPAPQAPDEQPTAGLSLNINGSVATLPLVSNFVSMVTFSMSQRLQYVFWDFKTEAHIGDFTDAKSFIEAFTKLVFAVVKRYDGIRYNVSMVPEPKFGETKITAPGSIGFDPYKFVEQLQDDKYKALATFFKTISEQPFFINGVKQVNKKKKPVFAHPLEVDLMNKLQAVNERWLETVDREWSWFKNLDTQYDQLQELPADLDRRFRFSVRPRITQAWRYLVDKNAFMWKVVADVGSTLLRECVPIKAVEEGRSVVELLQRMEVPLNRMVQRSLVAASMTKQTAETFIHQLLIALIFGRWVRLRYPVDLDHFDLTQLIDIIIMKLITPLQVWDTGSVIDMDNYLARWLIPACPGYNAQRDTFNLATAKQRLRNYLTDAETSGVLGNLPLEPDLGRGYRGNQSVLRSLMEFARTDFTGHGWCCTEAWQMESFPRDSAAYLDRSDVFYVYYSGRYITEPAVESTTQFDRYLTFTRAIAGRNGFGGVFQSDIKIGLSAIIGKVAELSSRVSQMARWMDLVMKDLALLSIVAPIRPGENFVSDDSRSPAAYQRIDVKMGSALSTVILTDFSTQIPVQVQIKHIRWAWSVHEFCVEMAQKWDFIQRSFKLPYWRKSDKISLLMEYLESDPGFKGMLLKKLGSAPIVNDFNIPPLILVPRDWLDKIQYATDFVSRLMPQHGFVDEFYFVPSATLSRDGQPVNVTLGQRPVIFRREWHTTGPPTYTYSRSQLQELVQAVGLASTFQSARNNGSILRFKFPIRLRHMNTNEVIEEKVPIEFNTSKSVVTKQVDFPYAWADEVDTDFANRAALERAPEFLLGAPPMILEDHAFIRVMLNYMVVWEEGFGIYDGYAFIPRAT